ncbi:hypothetical protein Tco_1053527, partial [Tanacetum coccineum]
MLTTDVPTVYLQQFWRTVSKVPGPEDTIKFMLNTQEFIYIVDMFRDILHLLVETLENPFVTPVNIETIEAFMNRVAYQGGVDKVSAFYTKNLAQPWQTMFKDFINNVRQKKEAIQYPRLIKLILADLMKKFLDIPQRIEEDYHSIKDDIPLVSVYINRDVRVRGMLILDAFLTKEIRATDDFKEYEIVFMNVDVPMNQPQLVVSTQGTPRQQKVVEREKDEDDSEDRLEPGSHKDNLEHVDDDDEKDVETVDEEEGDRDAFRLEVPYLVSQEFNAQEPKIIENVFKNYAQSNVIQVHPPTTTSTETTSSTDLQQQLYFKMKISLQDQANDPALWEVLKCKFEKSSTSNTSFRNADIHSHHDDHQEDDAPLEGEKRVKMHKAGKSLKSARGPSSKHSARDSTTYVFKQQQQEWDAWVEETVTDEDEAILEDETPELITELQVVDKHVPTIFVYERMKVAINDALSNQFKNAEEYAYHLEQTTNFMENQIVWESRQEDIRRPVPRPLVFFGPQRNPNEPPRYLYNKDLFFLKYGNTEEEKYILLLNKIHVERFLEVDLKEKMNHSWHKRVYKQNQRRVRNNPEEYFSNHRITEVVRITTDQPHGLDFMEQIIVMRENDKSDSFSEADFKYLNKNDIEDLYYLCRNKKVNYRETKLMNSLITFIRSRVIWERVHDFQLGIESYQIKVNLTTPILTFL